MKLLVIGGSYFLGRVFVMQAVKEHDITVVNRGTLSLEGLGVKQVKGDRREPSVWAEIKEDFDVVVDFCAYEKGDIATVLRNIQAGVKQYIFISTLDVYRRGMKNVKTEDAPFEDRVFPGEAGAYIAGKVALEQELREECAWAGIAHTVLRPAFIYGPLNYAPRESAYIQLMVQNYILPHIVDAAGTFQFVYVKDAAEAAVKCLLNPAAYGQAYNLCQEEPVTYETFYRALRTAAEADWETVEGAGTELRAEPGARVDTEMGTGVGTSMENGQGAGTGTSADFGIGIREFPVTAAEAQDMGIPLPFPVTEEESELSSNEKSRTELGIRYLSLQEGMARTYRAFKGVYS